jgi:transcription antitermination factor NusG
MEPTGSIHSWFAVQVKTRRESAVATILGGKGYEAFLPTYKSRRRWSDRIKELELPLFPGYLFCRFNAQNRLPILTTPGVVQIVGIGRNPMPLEESEIAAIQVVVRSGLSREPWPFLQVGGRVRIEGGPLYGLEGIVLAFKGRNRLVLSVTLLQRSVAVEIDGDWASSVPRPRNAPIDSVAAMQLTRPLAV